MLNKMKFNQLETWIKKNDCKIKLNEKVLSFDCWHTIKAKVIRIIFLTDTWYITLDVNNNLFIRIVDDLGHENIIDYNSRLIKRHLI